MPFVHAPMRCQFCGRVAEDVAPERQPDGSSRWLCRDVVACGQRRFPPHPSGDAYYSIFGEYRIGRLP